MSAPKYPKPTDEVIQLHRPCQFYPIEEGNGCRARNKRHLLCSRETGHAGPHIAHGVSRYVRFAVWNDEEEQP